MAIRTWLAFFVGDFALANGPVVVITPW